MPTDRILDVSGLWAGYGATPILQGVSMSVSRGEIVGVIGRNGVGKSTLMRCLIGLLDTWRGTITFMNQDITSFQADARARAGFGYIPQGRDVFPQMSVEENLQVGELIGGPKGKKLPELVYEYFPRLKERRRQIAGTMSGGEQQQLAIGRALIGNPSLMILDEPSEGVQPSIVQNICDALKSFRERTRDDDRLRRAESRYDSGDRRTLLHHGEGHDHAVADRCECQRGQCPRATAFMTPITIHEQVPFARDGLL